MFKEQKSRELLIGLAAEFFSKQSNRTSLITMTNLEFSQRSQRATLLFTVLPESQEQAALDFVRRQLGEFRKYVMDHARMMHVPYFEANIDRGEKNRQRMDDLSRKV